MPSTEERPQHNDEDDPMLSYQYQTVDAILRGAQQQSEPPPPKEQGSIQNQVSPIMTPAQQQQQEELELSKTMEAIKGDSPAPFVFKRFSEQQHSDFELSDGLG